MKINLGAGLKPLEGWRNYDINPMAPGVIKRDVLRGIPLDDDSCDEVLADNLLEHVRPGEDSIFIVNEIYRVCKPGALVTIIVPHAHSQGAWQDPTHQNAYVPRKALYWNLDICWPKMMGSTANFDFETPLTPEHANYPAFRIWGDMATEAFIEFRLRARPKA